MKLLRYQAGKVTIINNKNFGDNCTIEDDIDEKDIEGYGDVVNDNG